MSLVDELKLSLAQRKLIIIAGNCRVEYEGRAASHLGEGERLVIIKPDGSVLVHRPFGYEPVNWNPPNSKIEVSQNEENSIIVTSYRSGEKLVIMFSEIKHFASLTLSDEADFEMYASESDMKRAVLLNPSLIEEGFTPIEEERKAFGKGRIDILGRDSNGNLVVVELKRNEASISDINQLIGYMETLKREFGKRPRAVIAAPSISRRALMLASSNNIEFKCLTPRMCMEVIKKSKGLDRFFD